MERAKIIYDDYVLFENGVILSIIKNRFLDGSVSSGGYIIINLNGKNYRLHRLLAQSFIENPNGYDEVDHIDRNRLNNDLSNLRWCSRSQNSHNHSKQSNNTTGEIGISKLTKRGKPFWRIQVKLNGKRHCRCFRSYSDLIPQEVIDARDRLKRELHGEFASF
jgi:hypothetical protein